VDFKNTLVIMTSNIGSSNIDRDKTMGFKTSSDPRTDGRQRDVVLQELKKTLSPEFLNRIDETIVFDPLSEDQLLSICRLMIERLSETLKARNLELKATDDACRWLLKATEKDRAYGARPLRRAIQKHIEDALSENLIQGRFASVSQIEVYVEGGKIAFRQVAELKTAN
jgi:ATP-dependent Clp protease ATP-binding subunit ClpC